MCGGIAGERAKASSRKPWGCQWTRVGASSNSAITSRARFIWSWFAAKRQKKNKTADYSAASRDEYATLRNTSTAEDAETTRRFDAGAAEAAPARFRTISPNKDLIRTKSRSGCIDSDRQGVCRPVPTALSA